jgi:putative hydrolase of the HAD superfamily
MLEQEGCALEPHVLVMDELYWGTLMEAAKPSQGAIEVMKDLKRQGIRIGVGTDMTARMQLRKLTKLGMLSYVDFLVSSEEAGVEKPHQRFFARIVEKAGCEKQECLFVGDNQKKDVLGAMDAGLKAVWYCPEGCSTHTELLQIANLTQLSQLIKGL